jgi:hypothetical protein
MIPNVRGTRTEMHGAASIQTMLKRQEVADSKTDEEVVEGIVEDINALSIKYGGLSDATTVSGALANVEAVIRNLEGQIPTLTTLNVTANDTYTAPSGTAYNEVVVNVQ